MKYPATQRWPAPSSTGSCTTPTASSSRAKACTSSGLPDESAHSRAGLVECPAAYCNALRVRQAKLARSSRWKTGAGKG